MTEQAVKVSDARLTKPMPIEEAELRLSLAVVNKRSPMLASACETALRELVQARRRLEEARELLQDARAVAGVCRLGFELEEDIDAWLKEGT